MFLRVGPLFFRIIADNWSLKFFGLLLLVSGRVLSWSYYYMDREEYYGRFIRLVIAFVGSIVILIFIRRLMGALIGWDGLGVTSFLLVIYYKNRKSLGSGMITALTNRLGDCFFLLILGLRREDFFYWWLLLLLLTSITKRAQIPFSSWLPSAMAAPTPVRALVHSSTLVTAGVYLLLRFNDKSREWIIVIGRLTILMAGVGACVEMDIKKIVALSTLSQLGVIIISLALDQKALCFFHLVTHAIFKALLFICVGTAIHRVYGTQDFRSFRNLGKGIIYPVGGLIVANIALIGFPFMSGFYRKDRIMERFYSSNRCYWGGVIFLVGVGMTTSYRIKLINLACLRTGRGVPTRMRGGWQIKMPVGVLGFFSVVRGFIIGQRNIVEVVVVDKVIPLLIIIAGGVRGAILSNYKNKNFSSILILRPIFQKVRWYRVKGEIVKLGDIGITEELGGPGLLATGKTFFYTFHPIIAVSLIVLVIGLC